MRKVKRIYVDMDGVLANFEEQNNAIERYVNEPDFFEQLTPIKRNLKAIRLLMTLDNIEIKILSAAPHQQADNSKRKWLRRYLPEMSNNNVILCRNWESKFDFVEEIESALLIDDYKGNLIPFVSNGGQAVKFINEYDMFSVECSKHPIYQTTDLLDFIIKA